MLPTLETLQSRLSQLRRQQHADNVSLVAARTANVDPAYVAFLVRRVALLAAAVELRKAQIAEMES